MENAKKTDLRQRKVSLKTKLMSALSLLLVSTILLGTSTYAWFVLSTAPEVKGMSTTVGANGSLEIALRHMNEAGTAEETNISSGVGDSMSTQEATKANNTWGNLIDLSDRSYGLNTDASNKINLYPARLNVTADGESFKVNTASPLLAPRYGTDGRVASVSKTLNTGRYTLEGYMQDQVGVRGIGDYQVSNSSTQTYTKIELARDAQSSALDAVKKVNGNLEDAIKAVIQPLMAIPDDAETISDAAGGKIIEFLTTFQNQAKALQRAGGYAQLMLDLDKDDFVKLDKAPTVILNEYATNAENGTLSIDAGNTIATKANAIREGADAALATAQEDHTDGGTYSVAKLKQAVNNIFAYNNMILVNDEHPTGVRLGTITNKQQAVGAATALYIFGGTGDTNCGAIASVAELTGSFSFQILATNVYVTSNAYSTELNGENNALIVAANLPVTVKEGDATEYETNASKGNTYGFMVDLAFRSNSATGLALTADGKDRVEGDGDQSTELQGEGSTIDAPESVRGSVLVAFINPDTGALYGVAKAGNDGKLAMYKVTAVTDGKLTLEAADNQTILSQVGTGTDYSKVSVIVYLDGDTFQSESANGQTVNVNLQFTSTVPLTPMDYTGYLTTGGTVAGENQTQAQNDLTLAADPTAPIFNGTSGTATITVKLGEETITPTSFSLSSTTLDESEMNITDAGVLTVDAAGTVTVTATYTAGGVTHTGSVEVTFTTGG